MQNLKIRVNSEAESKEAQELLSGLGYIRNNWLWLGCKEYPIELRTRDKGYSDFKLNAENEIERQEITIPELRAMVHPMKEYLVPDNGGYRVAVQDAGLPIAEDWIAIPDGAVKFLFSKENGSNYHFANENNQLMSLTDIHYGKPYWYGNAENYMNICKVDVLWQRATHPEELPFIDDEPRGLNDQYAEIEQVRQATKDNVNHPSHYTQGKVECIDALESATIGKSGIEAVCVANIIKYLWRYEEKNGVEDVKKAQFYLNRLLATLENKP